MRGRLRLLPILIFSATCLLSIKVIDLADGLFVHVPTLAVGQSLAAADPAEQADAADHAATEHAEESPSEPLAPHGDVAAEHGPEEAAEPEMADGAAAGDAGDEATETPDPFETVVLALGDAQPYETPPLPLGDGSFVGGGTGERVYTPEELAVLQALSDRRDALDEREQILEARERQLAVAEQRIDEKIAELADLQVRIEELLALYDANEEEEIMSLVKIYETMKPKDAAPIFDTLDMDILLDIISRMSNIRSAPILARMDPARAQEVTELLAERLQSRPDFMEDPITQ